MRNWKLSLVAMALALSAAVWSAPSASAQFGTYYSGYSVPAYGPPIGPPIIVARPVVVAPPVQIVTAYRPVVPTYVAPAAYSAYRPAYPVVPTPVLAAPVYPTPAYGTVARYRSGFVGPGLGGAPSVYTPGQPVRNAIRYVVP